LVESSGGIPTPPYSPVHFVPHMVDWGQIWTVWRPIEWVNVMIGEKILTLWLHGAGHYPAGKLGDAVAQMELQPAGGFHPYINPLDWPPYSPDVSPMEHLWDKMDRRVRGRRNAPPYSRPIKGCLVGRVG
jgi:hypothetical protein